jgi:hypothetical protein
MITRDDSKRGINTVLLATYRKLEKARNYNSTFYFNMATMNDSISSMKDVVRSMWENSVSYANKINALRKLLYGKIRELYESAIKAIEAWNKALTRQTEVAQELIQKQAEYAYEVNYTLVCQNNYQTAQEYYNTWYTDVYLPNIAASTEKYNEASTAWNTQKVAKQAYIDNYYATQKPYNWNELNHMYDFVEDMGLEYYLKNVVQYTTEYNAVIAYVNNTSPSDRLRMYRIGVKLVPDPASTSNYLPVMTMYEMKYGDPDVETVMYTITGDDWTTNGHPSDNDVDTFVQAARGWITDKNDFNKDYNDYKEINRVYVETCEQYDLLIDSYYSTMLAWQQVISNWNEQEGQLRQNVLDAYKTWQDQILHQQQVYIELIQKGWEATAAVNNTLVAFNNAVAKSVIYNDTVKKAHEEQQKQGKVPEDYPVLPYPFNTYDSDTVPKPDDMPDKPVEVPDDDE